MTTEELRKSILQLAIQGKLVEQNPADEPAYVLLERIRAEKERLIKDKKIKRDKNESVIYRGDDGSFFERIGKEVRCIDDEIPFEIPDSWEWVRHNEIFEISGGSQPPKSKFIENPKEGYIRLFQIRDYGKSPQPIYIPIETASKQTSKGDILLARYGASLGKVFIAEDGAYNVAMAKVILLFNKDNINSDYLFLYYNGNIYQQCVLGNARSAQAGFNKEDLSHLLIPLPPLAEQERIVERLNDLEPLFAEYQRLELQESKLEKNFSGDLNKSILQYAIQGKLVAQNPADEPASVLLERIRAEKERLIKDKKIKRDKNESVIYRGDNGSFLERIGKEVRCIDDEIPFEIPDNWEWCRLSTIMSRVTSGSTPTGGKSVYTDNGIKFIRSQNVHNNGLRLNNVAYISNMIHDSKQNSHVKANDLLLNITGASIGRCAIVPSDFDTGNINQHILILRLINLELMLFVHLAITSPLVFQQIMTLQVGGTKEGLSAEKANRLLMPIPPLSEQKRIVEKLEQIKQQIK